MLQNYGDESGAYGLMYPSIYSNKGVYEEDFFAPRQPEEVGGTSSHVISCVCVLRCMLPQSTLPMRPGIGQIN